MANINGSAARVGSGVSTEAESVTSTLVDVMARQLPGYLSGANGRLSRVLRSAIAALQVSNAAFVDAVLGVIGLPKTRQALAKFVEAQGLDMFAWMGKEEAQRRLLLPLIEDEGLVRVLILELTVRLDGYPPSEHELDERVELVRKAYAERLLS